MNWTPEEVKSYLARLRGRAQVPSWTERYFQNEVCKMATQLGWVWFHVVDSFHCAAGFPDLVMVRGARVVFAELKTEKGKIEPEQAKWLKLLEPTPVEQYLWRPSMIDEIVRILR